VFRVYKCLGKDRRDIRTINILSGVIKVEPGCLTILCEGRKKWFGTEKKKGSGWSVWFGTD